MQEEGVNLPPQGGGRFLVAGGGDFLGAFLKKSPVVAPPLGGGRFLVAQGGGDFLLRREYFWLCGGGDFLEPFLMFCGCTGNREDLWLRVEAPYDQFLAKQKTQKRKIKQFSHLPSLKGSHLLWQGI